MEQRPVLRLENPISVERPQGAVLRCKHNYIAGSAAAYNNCMTIYQCPDGHESSKTAGECIICGKDLEARELTKTA